MQTAGTFGTLHSCKCFSALNELSMAGPRRFLTRSTLRKGCGRGTLHTHPGLERIGLLLLLLLRNCCISRVCMYGTATTHHQRATTIHHHHHHSTPPLNTTTDATHHHHHLPLITTATIHHHHHCLSLPPTPTTTTNATHTVRSPEAFRFFCETHVPFQLVHYKVKASGPPFRLKNPLSEKDWDELIAAGPGAAPMPPLSLVRFNNDDRAPITSLSTSNVERFYRYLPLLLDALRDPASVLKIGLEKGDMVVTNNHRCVARTASCMT
jgi:hypothetical protein